MECQYIVCHYYITYNFSVLQVTATRLLFWSWWKVKHVFSELAMATWETWTKTQKTICGTTYSESHALLPTKKDVVECMMYLMWKDRAGKQQHTVSDGTNLLAFILTQHWEDCNIYTITLKNATRWFEKLYAEFQINVPQRKVWQTGAWQQRMNIYNANMQTLFDIFCEWWS